MSSCNPEPSGNESVDSDGSALKPLSELKSQLLLSILAARGTLSSSSGVVGAVDLFHAALDGLQLHAAHICFEDSASAVQFVRCHQLPLTLGRVLGESRHASSLHRSIPKLTRALAVHCHNLYLRPEDSSLHPAVGLAVAQQCTQSGVVPMLCQTMTLTQVGIAESDIQEVVVLAAAELDLFRAICCAWPGGILKSAVASTTAAPGVRLGLELLRKLARPAEAASQAEPHRQLTQAVLRSCVASGFHLVQQLAARLDADGPQDWAALQSRLLPGEQLVAQGSLPDLLELVLLVLSRQVLHLAQYDWCRGLSPLQLHAWQLQEAASASADGVALDIARRLEQLHAEIAVVRSSRSSSNSNDGADDSRLLASLKHQLSDGVAEAVVNAAHWLGSKVEEAGYKLLSPVHADQH